MKYLVLITISIVIFSSHRITKSITTQENVDADFTAKNFGIGKLKINFLLTTLKSEEYVLDFFENINDSKPTFKLTLKWSNEDGGRVEISNKEYIKIKDFFIEEPYYIIHFNCFAKQNGLYQVMIDEDTQKRMWIKKSSTIEFITWSNYILDVVSIKQIDFLKNPVRMKPNENSEIVYSKSMDWEVVSIKGNWVEVKFSEIFMDMTIPENQKFRGWMKWKDAEKLLIEYGLAI